MSVAVARTIGATDKFDGSETGSTEDVDWGTATPINHIVEVINDKKLHKAISRSEWKAAAYRRASDEDIPRRQRALLLHGLRQPFSLVEDHAVPDIARRDEVVVKVQAIGLNPIDWKSVDYGFGIPTLPYVPGRDFAGVVVRAPAEESHIQVGDRVLCGSTDYRDLRKSAYQHYAIASAHTIARLPAHVPVVQGAALGVAYIAAVLALGICLGLPLPDVGSRSSSDGSNLRRIARRLSLEELPADTVPEILGIESDEIPQSGDWLVIWGGSSTSALFLSQMARLAGLKVILVVDVAKHGARMVEFHDCILVDCHNVDRASQIIRGLTDNRLRFGIDTVGKQTTEALVQCLNVEDNKRAHIVGLAALPKERVSGVVYHSVPIKLCHEVAEIGRELMTWLEVALQTRALKLPLVERVDGGLQGINAALDRMRRGQISGRRLVVPLD